MKVKDPSGQTWRVTRRWVPWRRRLSGSPDFSIPDVGSVADDPIGLILLLVLLLLALPFILLGLFAAIEFFLVLLVLPFAILGRVLFGRHWHVEARRGFTPVHEVRAGSWQESRAKIRELALGISEGQVLEHNLGD